VAQVWLVAHGQPDSASLWSGCPPRLPALAPTPADRIIRPHTERAVRSADVRLHPTDTTPKSGVTRRETSPSRDPFRRARLTENARSMLTNAAGVFCWSS